MKKILILFFLALICSCSNEFENLENVENQESLFLNKDLTEINLERENRLKAEMTLLVSRALNSHNVRLELMNFVKTVDTIYSTVSISALLKRNTYLSFVEIRNLDYLNINLNYLLPNESFKRNILFELKRSGKEEYPVLLDNLEMRTAKDTQIVDQIISYDLSLVFPDLDLFDWSQVNSFKSTFVPTTLNGENKALQVGAFDINNVEDLDVCSCPPETPSGYTLIEGDGFTEDIATVIIEDTSHYEWDQFYSEDPTGGGGSSGGSYGPPLITNPTVLLDYNFNYYQMPDEDYLLTSGIPRIQVRDGWRRWGSSKTRLRIYRAKSNFSVNSDGEIVASPSTYMQGYNVSRYATRRNRWRSINMEWDPNIKEEEKSQQIVIFQQRRGASSSTTSFSTKNNVDDEGNFSTSNTTTTSHTIDHDKAYLRVSRELDLFNLAIYNVGGNPHHQDETRNFNDAEQSVLANGQVKFFFEFYYTDLSN